MNTLACVIAAVGIAWYASRSSATSRPTTPSRSPTSYAPSFPDYPYYYEPQPYASRQEERTLSYPSWSNYPPTPVHSSPPRSSISTDQPSNPTTNSSTSRTTTTLSNPSLSLTSSSSSASSTIHNYAAPEETRQEVQRTLDLTQSLRRGRTQATEEKGTVAVLPRGKDFGFLNSSATGNERIFFHFNVVVGDIGPELKVGDQVTYCYYMKKGKVKVVQVKRMEQTPQSGVVTVLPLIVANRGKQKKKWGEVRLGNGSLAIFDGTHFSPSGVPEAQVRLGTQVSCTLRRNKSGELLEWNVKGGKRMVVDKLLSISDDSSSSLSPSAARESPQSTTYDGLLCSICMDDPKEVLFLNCRHVVCCSPCALQVNSCPICRMPIVQRIEIRIA